MPMLFRWGVFFLLGLMLLSAQAQSNRDGFYIGIDASFETLSVKSTTATENFGSGTSAVLHGGYELSIQDNYAVLFGGTYDLDYLMQGGSGSNGTTFTKGTDQLHQKTKWGLYAAPGMYLTQDSLLYAKLIYSTMKTDPDGVRSSTPNFTSVGYGVGYRYTFMQDNLITVEWATLPTQQKSFASFKSGSAIAPNLSMFTVGWARKF